MLCNLLLPDTSSGLFSSAIVFLVWVLGASNHSLTEQFHSEALQHVVETVNIENLPQFINNPFESKPYFFWSQGNK